jgi:aldehyde dehydrogenase (NAD+)
MMTNNKYTRLVKLQKAFFNEHITREIPFRLCALDRLAEALVSREKQLGEALHADLGKSAFESYATEIGFLLHEIRTTKNHLQSWARDRHRPTPLFLFGSKSRIHYEPYGCALIIAPWNYPLQLALSPLIGAIVAGNCAIVKPSGEAPRTAAALQELIDECFEEEYIAVTDADRETTELLLQERFDYIFYTGGVEYGCHVMQAASRHLTPVTLELGGKSPCIVDDDADLKAAARRIVWGKFLNCGQTCVAPDYLMVHRKVQDKLTEYICDEITRQYGENPQQSPDYPRIVNARHFDRLSALLSHKQSLFHRLSSSLIASLNQSGPLFKTAA